MKPLKKAHSLLIAVLVLAACASAGEAGRPVEVMDLAKADARARAEAPAVLQAQAELAAAGHRARRGLAVGMPQVTGSASWTQRNETDVAVVGQASSRRRVGASLKAEQPLWTGGQLDAARMEGRGSCGQATAALAAARRDAALSARLAVLAAARTVDRLAILKTAAADRRAEEAVVARLFTAGQADRLEQSEAEVATMAADEAAARARLERERADRDLAILLLLPLGSITVTQSLATPGDGDAVAAQAQSHPGIDHERLRSAWVESLGQVQGARAQRMPTVSLRGEAGVAGGRIEQQWPVWSVGVEASWTIFSGFALEAAEAEAVARLAAARRAVDDQERERALSIQGLIADRAALAVRLTAQQHLVERFAENHAAAVRLYSAGQVIFTRLRQAADQLVQARLLHLDLRHEDAGVFEKLRSASETLPASASGTLPGSASETLPRSPAKIGDGHGR